MDEPFSALDVLTAETLRTDLIDLWIEGRLPIKSVLMVTHNIEEAVLMCDRILVFSSNPGRVAAEIKIDLPHPRNRLDPTFRQLVDSIYARMTQRPEARTPTIEGIQGTGVGMILNHVSSNVLSGLIETLAGPPYNGHADLPVLAGHLQLEADEIFHLGESLQLLRFAQLSEGDLMLTDAGKRFAHLETDARKRLFAEHLMNYVPVMGLIRRVLDERPSHTAPAARFRNELEDYMAEDQADETLKTIVSWARYAELFAYDEQSETVQPGKSALGSALGEVETGSRPAAAGRDFWHCTVVRIIPAGRVICCISSLNAFCRASSSRRCRKLQSAVRRSGR